MDRAEKLRRQLAECRERLEEAEKSEAAALERVKFLTEVIGSSENIIVMVMDAKGRIKFSSRSLHAQLGSSPNETAGVSGWWDLSSPEQLLLTRNLHDSLVHKPVGASARWRLRMPHKDGGRHDVDLMLINRLDHPVNGIVCFLRVVTSEARAEKEAQDIEGVLRTVINGVHDGILVHDLKGKIVHANGKFLDMFDISGHDAWSTGGADQYFVEHMEGLALSQIWERILGGEIRLFEWKARKPEDDTEFDVEVFLRKIRLRGEDYILSSIRDISDRKRAEAELKAALQEKEVLLREIHHRVKNNLQVMCSLFRLQGRYAPDDLYRGMFRDAETRIRSMALVHEHLYRSAHLAAIDTGKYMHDLIGHLSGTYVSERERVGVSLDIEKMLLGPRTLIPLGFIVCELFGNAIKHAFPGDRKGRIDISLHSLGENETELRIRDDGVGSVGQRDFESPNSLGLRLVKIFTEQLEGELEIRDTEGTDVYVKFHVDSG
jgi:PAS domain S-box-containing protein